MARLAGIDLPREKIYAAWQRKMPLFIYLVKFELEASITRQLS